MRNTKNLDVVAKLNRSQGSHYFERELAFTRMWLLNRKSGNYAGEDPGM
jgi:hypothetical protein